MVNFDATSSSQLHFFFLLLPSRWQKLIQGPYENGDERGLRLVKAILRPLMLRRTKETKDKDGRQVISLLTPISALFLFQASNHVSLNISGQFSFFLLQMYRLWNVSNHRQSVISMIPFLVDQRLVFFTCLRTIVSLE